VSKYGDLKSEDLFSALKKQIEDTKLRSVDFARLCGEECENYIQLITLEEQALKKEAVPFVRALVQELNFQAAFPLLLSTYLLLQREHFVKVTQWLLIFLTRYSIMANQNHAGMEDLLFSLAREVRSMLPPLEAGEERDFEESKRCATYIKEQLISRAPTDDKVKELAKDLVFNDPADAKYVVSRLARYIQDTTKATTLGEANLEHIYPQNPSPFIYGGEAGQEILEPFTWHLGNLTIFGTRANRKVGNNDFIFKKPRYAASLVKMTKEVAERYDDWDIETIRARAARLAKIVVIVWNFDNTSRV